MKKQNAKSLGAKAAEETDKKTLRVFFLRDKRKKPVACVATTKEDGRIRYAISTYNPSDDFNRERARQITVDRLESHPNANPTFEAKSGVKVQVIQAIASDVRTHEVRSRKPPHKMVTVTIIPRRSREAAQYWLKHPELHQPRVRK